MSYKYLYVDDTKDDLEQGMINALTDGGEIEIKFQEPDDWEKIITWFETTLPEYDGVILDLRLNDQPYEDNKFAKYKGSTIAQELRNLIKEGVLNDFPIVLFSGTDNLDHYLDPTSKDLFDIIIDKTKVEQPDYYNYDDFRTKLKWLVDGYRSINEIGEKSIYKYFGNDEPDPSIYDSRFIEYFYHLLEKPTHILVQFLIKEVINKPGFLISEDYLLARLGVDREKSADYKSLLEKLEQYKYKGVFSGYYSRYWMPLISRFWNEKISDNLHLRNLSASERVVLLNEKLGLNLSAIDKTLRSKSDSFWVNCKATGVAIDTIDGFIVAGQHNRFPWQEPEYISVDEALRPTKHCPISVTEKPRLEKLKALLEKNEQRIRK